ncbi:MAG: hypothetical protein ABIK18_05490 [candidate division WOR-3 bacterium]
MRLLANFFLLLFAAEALFAQKAPPFLIIPDENKVYVILASPPKEMVSWTVSRKAKGEKEFTLFTPEPITKIKDPLLIREFFPEEEYNWLAQVFKAEDEFTFYRRIMDPGVGGALSLVSLNVAKVLGKLFIDTTARSNEEYIYRISFINYQGEEFSRVEARVIVRKHKPPPNQVTKIVFSVGKDYIKLEWDYPKWTGRKEDIVVGFNIYKRSLEEGEFKKVLPFPYLRTGERIFYIDRKVEEGKTYEYYLTAVDLIGAEGPKSEVVVVKVKDITPPPPPLEVVATPEEGEIVITWEPSLAEDVVGYNIYRSWSIHGEFKRINKEPIPKEERRFVDKDVSATGMLYVYRVSAIDDDGLEGEKSTAAFGMPKDTTPPPAVANLRAKVEKRMVKLTWEPQRTPDLDGYYVYRAEEKERLFRLVGPPLSKNSPFFVDSGFSSKGLYPGRNYYYYVSQVDIAMNEGKRTMIEVKIPDDEPPMPPPEVYCQNNDDGTVTVKWQVSLALDLAKYYIYRQREGASPQRIAEVGMNTNSYLDRTCEKGVAYYYFVSAVDSVGNESERIKFHITPRDIYSPPTPKGLKVSYVANRINLTWEKVLADDLDGYNVYRSELPTGVYVKLNKKPWKTEGFSDPEGKKGYYYRVTSVDTSGNESNKSEPATVSESRVP